MSESCSGAGSRAPTKWRRRFEALGVSALGGVIFWLGTQTEGLGPLVGLGYVVLMTPALVERWRAPVWGFLPGFMGAMWASHIPLAMFGTFVAVLLPPLLSWHYVFAPIGARLLVGATRWPAFVVIPLSFGAAEWLRPILGLGNFNMYGPGTFLFDYPVLIQAADVVGAIGLSVFWMVPLSLLVDLLRRRLDGPGAFSPSAWRAGALLSVLLLTFLTAYGAWRMRTVEINYGPRIAVIQASEDRGAELIERVVRVQRQMTLEHVPAGAADMIVWPENSILVDYPSSEKYQQVMEALARSREAALLFGAQATGPDGKRETNSTFLVDAGGIERGHYDKVVLFPFTERRVLVFLRDIWPGLHRQIDRFVLKAWRTAPNGWSPDRITTLVFPEGAETGIQSEELRFWTPVCYESCYPWLGRQAMDEGARFFVNLTSEGWLGWSASRNMMAVNVLRAVEARVGLVRAGNTGPSAFVLPTGEVDRYLRGFRHGRLRLEPGVLIHRVALGEGERTIYGAIGGVLDPAWFWLWALATIGGFARSRRAGSREAEESAEGARGAVA